jgi:tricarballylate dehydrogenase
VTSWAEQGPTGYADVVVVGGGNAGMCAALAAAEAGASVVLIDKAGEADAGGNSYFTAGAFRTTFDGLDDLSPMLTGLNDERASLVDLAPYRHDDFLADLTRITEGRADPALAGTLVRQSRPALEWLATHGVRFELMFHRQAYEVGGRFRFWGGLALGSVGGGKGLVDAELSAVRAAGVDVRFATAGTALLRGQNGAITGVLTTGPDGPGELQAGAVVLCSGGFQANPQWRAAYLGTGWDLAAVRGTRHNTGDGIAMALAAGAQPCGHWSGCHSVAWDAGAGAYGDRELTNQLTRNGYPLGIMVNRRAERFVDEGADFRNYTYARYGAKILEQPGAVAYQLFDARSSALLRPEEYESPGATRVVADSIADLARALQLDVAILEQTVAAFNKSIGDAPFDPSIKDGRSTTGIRPPKSNWSLPLSTAPFVAYPVTCGVTFTFGGLRVDTDARVLDISGRPLPGLWAAGELVGGIFHHNYPGGSGLTLGTVLGRRAGEAAARHARGASGARRPPGEPALPAQRYDPRPDHRSG